MGQSSNFNAIVTVRNSQMSDMENRKSTPYMSPGKWRDIDLIADPICSDDNLLFLSVIQIRKETMVGYVT